MNVGSHLGQYRIVRKIGAGGMGTVFVGEHILLGRSAAIKTLLPSLSTHAEVVARFFREARAASAVTDPGVVQIYDFGYHVDGTAYIVMELLEGESLACRLRRLGVLPPSEALRIGRQIAGALAAVHAAGVVHRDLKPENIFLVRDAEALGGERAKLLDFGICKLGDEDDTDASTAVGTPMYMAPEQCVGVGVDGRADIYGLGCVLFEMLTGDVPFEREHREQIMEAHVADVPPVPSQHTPELVPLIDEIVAHCLAKSPADRFQSMTALQQAIDQILPKLTPVPLAAEAPVGVALAPGFQTDFDGNFRGLVPKLSSNWFIPTNPELDTIHAATGELTVVQRSSNRSLIAIMLAGALVAVLGTVLALGHQKSDDPEVAAVTNALAAIPADDDGEPIPQPTPEPKPTEPMPEPEPDEPTPPTPPAPTDDPEPSPEPGPDTDAPNQDRAFAHEVGSARAAIPEKPGVAVRRTIAKSPPRTMRHTNRPPAKAPALEDLYDTR